MESLNKHQLILVALLISFVTSLATGIVTVSLMDQAPAGVTRTITQVVRETVASAVPTGTTNAAAVSISVNDQVADATASLVPSLVRLRDGDRGDVVGIGMLVSPTGAIMADKNLIDKLNIPQAVFGNDSAVPIVIQRFQVAGDIAFLVPQRSISISLKPITFGDDPKLGASVWSLTGTSTYSLSQGIITEIETGSDGATSVIHTSIPSSGLLPGAPLFDATGAVVGMATNTLTQSALATFYPTQRVRDGVPQ